MGHAATKSVNMAEGNNSVGVYENIESLGEEVRQQDSVSDLKDSITLGIRDTVNEVLAVMVTNVRLQEEILAAVVKNGERMEQIASLIQKQSPAQCNTLALNKHNGAENSHGPVSNRIKVCHKCLRPGHIRRECRSGKYMYR